MKTNGQIKIGALLSYLTIFVNIVTGIVYTPWMIRSIGSSDYGLYTLAMSLINTFTIDFGLGMAVQKYVSKHLADHDQKKADRTVGIVLKLYLLITALLLAIFISLYFFIGWIYPELSATEIKKFKVLYIIAAINCVVTFPFIPADGILHAYERFIESKICGFIHKIVTVTLTVTALFAGWGVYSLVAANLLGGILHILVRLYVIRKKTNMNPDLRYKDFSYLKEMMLFSFWASVSSLAIRFILTLQPSVLGMVAGTAEIAIFGYAVSLESYIYLFVNALNGFFLPTLTRMDKNEEAQKGEQISGLMTRVGRFILLLYGLMFIGFCAMGKEFITLLLGDGYIKSYYCTILICAYGLVAYPQQIANTYIMVKNKVKKRAIISAAALGLCMICSFVFGKKYGAVGVSAGICVSLILYVIFMNRMYRRDLKIDIASFFKNCHLKLLPGLLLHFILSVLISCIPLSGWLGFAVKTSAICLVYFMIAWFMMLERYEKNMITGIWNKILRRK